METTMAPSNLIEVRAEPEIFSSQANNNNDEIGKDNYKRHPRALFSFVSTITSTITSYSFIPTLIKKSFTLAGAGALSCLPAGYTVC